MPEIRLVVREPGQAERRVTLFPGATIGRAQGNGLTLADPAASRSHLRLLCENNRWFAEDVGSASGTVVDGGKSLQKGQRAPLKHGSQLEAGDTVMLVALEVETVDGTIPGVRSNKPAEAAEKVDSELNRTIPAPPVMKSKRAPAGDASATPPQKADGQKAVGQKAVGPKADGPRREQTERAGERTIPEPVRPATNKAPPSSPPRVEPPRVEPLRVEPPRAANVAKPAPEPAPSPPVVEAVVNDGGERTRRIETKEQEGIVLRPKLMARNARAVLVGSSVRRSMPIETTPFAVGRADTAQIVLTDNSISNEHAQLVFDDQNAFQLIDLGSRNGTFVGTERLPPNQPRVLQLPAWLRFGAIEAWLVDDASSSTAQERADRAVCDGLVRTGRMTKAEKQQAIDAARTGRRHISEMVLQQSRLSVAEWAEAVRRYPPQPARALWLLLGLGVVAIAGVVFWLLRGR